MEKRLPNHTIDESDNEMEDLKNQLKEFPFLKSSEALKSIKSIKKVSAICEYKV